MSTANALICALMFYGLLVLLGRGTLVLCRTRLSALETNSIAPAIGLAVLTLLTTYLVLSGLPLVRVAVPVTIALALLSLFVLISDRRVEGNSEELAFWSWAHLLPFFVTAALLALPFAIGGFEFAILRGNGTDAFNYVTMADALMHYPIDWVMSQPKDRLIAYSPSLPLAQDLLKERWSTSALLAFASAAFRIAPIEFEYTYTLTIMLVLYGALVTCLCATKTLTKVTVWLVVAFVAGFWGQFILDIRAFSQISALPLVALLLASLLSPIINAKGIFRYGAVLTAILFAALFLQYPEIVIAYFPGAGMVFLVRILADRGETGSRRSDFGALLGFVAMVVVLGGPMIEFIVGFAYYQARSAVDKARNWENAYFSWMNNPVSGIWGGGSSLGMGGMVDTLFALLGLTVGLLLTLGALAHLKKIIGNYPHWRENYSEVATFLLAASALGGATLLLIKGSPWSAGKVISFFSLLIPIFLASWLRPSTSFGSSAQPILISRAVTTAIYGWLALGTLFGSARLIHSEKGTSFGQYISGHGEHQRIGAGAISKIQNLGCPPHSRVAVFDPSIWAREFRTHLVEGNGFQVTTSPYSTMRNSIIDPYQAIDSSFDCVMASSKYFASFGAPTGQSTHEVFAYNKGDNFAALVEIEGGYGVELDRATSGRFVFTGKQEVVLQVLGRAEKFSVQLKLCPGANRKPGEDLTIFVEVDRVRTEEFQLAQCAEKVIYVTGDRVGFLKSIRLTSADPRAEPTLLGADPRDLRLRVDVVGVTL